jgi:hypothetical protein
MGGNDMRVELSTYDLMDAVKEFLERRGVKIPSDSNNELYIDTKYCTKKASEANIKNNGRKHEFLLTGDGYEQKSVLSEIYFGFEPEIIEED